MAASLTSQVGLAQVGAAQAGNSGGGVSFLISPNASHATGVKHITATGIGTTWTGSNPFSISNSAGGAISGLTNYVNISGTSATFDITQNSVPVGGVSGVISDSNSGTTQNFDPRAVVPNAPTSVVLTDNHDGTVTATYIQASDNGGSAITANSLLTSTGQTATASSPGAAITFTPANLIAITAQVRATNAVGNGPYSTASGSITPDNHNLVGIKVRAPYLSTDVIGTKTYQKYNIFGGALVADGPAVTTGFNTISNIVNGWVVHVQAAINQPFGDYSGIAVFGNINGNISAAVELYSPPTSTPSSLSAHKIAPFLASDTITTPGYQLFDIDEVAVGSHVTTGIYAIPGVTNGWVTLITATPDANGGKQLDITWDGG